MIISKIIRLDFTKPYTEPIRVNQNEVDSRDFIFYCSAGSLPINVVGAAVTFYAKKPDGELLYNACTILDGANGKVQYTMTEQTCAAAGDLQCWIEIIKGNEALRSFEFKVTAESSPDESGAIESTSEFTALETALSTVSGLDARVTQNESDIAQNESDIAGLLNFFYPVGTIYETVSADLDTAEKMAAHFGGTWVAWGTGRVPVGIDTGQTEFNTVEKTGGEKTHTLTQAELPVVDNGITVNGSERFRISFDAGSTENTLKMAYTGTTANGGTVLKTASNGSGQAHNNLQPYVACYMWKRTA